MIIRCGNKTRMFGSSVKIAKDFINITNAIRQGFTQKYDQQTADELIVDCIRLILFAETDRQAEAETDLVKVLMSFVET